MIKVVFFNVGQGDSILIDSVYDKNRRVIILDCNLVNKTNPVLDYIKNTGVEKINYCFLSHPHSDHFSGYLELLTFCIENDIELGHFLFSPMITDWLNVACRDYLSSSNLQKLLDLIRTLHPNKVKRYPMDPHNPVGDIPIGDGYLLKILAPDLEEQDNFGRRTIISNEEEEGNYAQANWLSSVLVLYNDQSYALFTSDTNIVTLKRIGKEFRKQGWEKKRRMILAQSPHHGAKGNHFSTFWNDRKKKGGMPVVISVGFNSYGHPHVDTVNYFMNGPYTLFSTSKIGGIIPYLTSTISSAHHSLGVFSSIISGPARNERFEGDKVFEIKSDQAVLLP